MPIVQTSVGALFCEQVGDGPPCLIAHGAPGTHHGMYRSLDPLQAAGRLVYWDHRGHGRSAPLPDGQIDMDLFAHDAIALADALGIERFPVVGHSFGGWVAQELAIRYPDRVTAAVLIATTPRLADMTGADPDAGPPPPPEVLEVYANLPTSDLEVAEFYRALAPHFLRDGDPTGYLEGLDPALLSVDGMVRVGEALVRWSSLDRLATVQCPTLVLAGRHDGFATPEQVAQIADRIPNAEHVVLENSGHFMWLEEPDAFFPLVTDFLRAH